MVREGGGDEQWSCGSSLEQKRSDFPRVEAMQGKVSISDLKIIPSPSDS